jgi:hypothetical protein
VRRPPGLAAAALACAGLASCVPPPFTPPAQGGLAGARLACNAQYPQKRGNYLPHAECVNAAVERYALPSAHHPDLVRLQEAARVHFSLKIDRGEITLRGGERGMRKADALTAEAGRDRDAGEADAARQKILAIEAMLR